MPLITSICVLAVVIVGLLVMTQAISLEEGHGIWRGRLFVVLAVVAVWLLKTALLPILICVLVWLKQSMLEALIAMLAVLAVGLFVRMAVFTFTKRNPSRGSRRQEGP